MSTHTSISTVKVQYRMDCSASYPEAHDMLDTIPTLFQARSHSPLNAKPHIFHALAYGQHPALAIRHKIRRRAGHLGSENKIASDCDQDQAFLGFFCNIVFASLRHREGFSKTSFLNPSRFSLRTPLSNAIGYCSPSLFPLGLASRIAYNASSPPIMERAPLCVSHEDLNNELSSNLHG